MKEELAVLVEWVTFFNEQSGFAVLRVKVQGQREPVTVLGPLPAVSAGEWLTAKDSWIRNQEHGLQFKAPVMQTVPPSTVEGVERFGWRFQVRDKVIQTENNARKDVFNGDIGTIERIDPVEQEVAICFDVRRVKYGFGELDEIALAYAVTIHKSQGSEFPAIVTPLSMQYDSTLT
ncbi:MAG: YrrC family ATP-dependent DNA helicase [Acidobacteriaceae bacterium]